MDLNSQQERKHCSEGSAFFSQCSWIVHTHVRAVQPSHHVDEYLNHKGICSFNLHATWCIKEIFTSIDPQCAASVRGCRIIKSSKFLRLKNLHFQDLHSFIKACQRGTISFVSLSQRARGRAHSAAISEDASGLFVLALVLVKLSTFTEAHDMDYEQKTAAEYSDRHLLICFSWSDLLSMFCLYELREWRRFAENVSVRLYISSLKLMFEFRLNLSLTFLKYVYFIYRSSIISTLHEIQIELTSFTKKVNCTKISVFVWNQVWFEALVSFYQTLLR